jgi:hypothetical protein
MFVDAIGSFASGLASAALEKAGLAAAHWNEVDG